MTDLWIVSDYKYKRQKTLEIAQGERKRLAEMHPEKKFRIYRIHQHATPSNAEVEVADKAAEVERLKQELHLLRHELVKGLAAFEAVCGENRSLKEKAAKGAA